MLKENFENESFEVDAPSRSQKKRESLALQVLGEELTVLAPALWLRLPLSPDLLVALQELTTMRTHESIRRQKQYIGKLMRGEDEMAIRTALCALN